MTHEMPNRVCAEKNDSTYRTHFGALYAAVPMHHVRGQGHDEHIKVNFYGGFSLELTRAAAIELARRLPEAIASMPFDPDADCSGAVWTGDGA